MPQFPLYPTLPTDNIPVDMMARLLQANMLLALKDYRVIHTPRVVNPMRTVTFRTAIDTMEIRQKLPITITNLLSLKKVIIFLPVSPNLRLLNILQRLRLTKTNSCRHQMEKEMNQHIVHTIKACQPWTRRTIPIYPLKTLIRHIPQRTVGLPSSLLKKDFVLASHVG